MVVGLVETQNKKWLLKKLSNLKIKIFLFIFLVEKKHFIFSVLNTEETKAKMKKKNLDICKNNFLKHTLRF